MPSPDPQPDLFGAPAAAGVEAASVDPEHAALAARLGPLLHLGTSSWHFPGWAGLVWARAEAESTLSRRGLEAYSRHPLLRTVSVDRSFYRPLDAREFAALAAQVPEAFRFVVKAPARVCDASIRDAGTGQVLRDNPLFLEPEAVVDLAWRPVARGLAAKLGSLVLQISPVPARWLRDPTRFLRALDRALGAIVEADREAQGRVGVELRNPELLGPELCDVLRRHGARYVASLHDRMPPLEAQLPMLRALWPGPLVVRWNLQRGLRYDAAKDRFAPFDRLAAPDEPTRLALAQLVAATLAAGLPAFVTINNKAEGSAPRSVVALAAAIDARLAGLQFHESPPQPPRATVGS